MFDAYHKWLGIPPGRRPPTHYQLLGINPTEQDRDVIESAAVRQTAYVRHFQAGAYGKECARILGELAQARLVLIDPLKRAAYDAQIAASEPAAPAPAPPPVPPVPPAGMTLTLAGPEARGRLTDRPARSSGKPAILGLAACALAGLAAVAYTLANRPPTGGTPPPTAAHGPAPAGAGAANPPAIRSKSPVVAAPTINPTGVARAGNIGSPAGPASTSAVYEVRTEPEGARVEVIGMPTARITAEKGSTRIEFPGVDGRTNVRLDATLAGYQPAHGMILPRPGEQRRYVIKLLPAPAPAPALATPGRERKVMPGLMARPDEETGDRPGGADAEVEVEAAATPHPDPRVIGAEALKFAGQPGVIRAVAFHPEGTRVAAAGEDGTVRVWFKKGNAPFKRFKGHIGAVNSLAFPDARRVLSGGKDGTVRLWNLAANSGAFVTRGDQHDVKYVAALPGGTEVVFLTSNRVSVLQMPEWKPVRGFDTNGRQRVLCMAATLKARHALMGRESGELRLFDLESGNELPVQAPGDRPKHLGEVTAVALSPEGERGLSGGLDGTLRLWDLGAGARGMAGSPSRLLRRSLGRVNALAISPDGRRALSASDPDGTVRLWDLDKGYETHYLRAHENDVTALAFSPDGRQALTGGLDKTLRLWDLPAPEGPAATVRKAAPADDGPDGKAESN